MALFELSELATHLQSDLDQASATAARQRAEDYMRIELGVEFTNTTRSWVARIPAGRTKIALPGPVTSITSITVDGTPLTDGWETTDWGVWCPTGFGDTATTDYVAVNITYVGGFITTPSELAGWGIYLAALSYRLAPLPGVAQETVGGVFTTHDPTLTRAGAMILPDHVLTMLRRRYGARRTVGSVAYR